MALKTQSNAMKAAYGQNFSQQDLTDPKENQLPQPLVTSTSKKGGIELLVSLARNRNLKFSGGGRKKTQARDDRMV